MSARQQTLERRQTVMKRPISLSGTEAKPKARRLAKSKEFSCTQQER